MKINDRFFDKIVVQPRTRCWVWIGARVNGYGHVTIDKIASLAHRVAYTRFVGPIPDGMMVCHRCDRPACVNPDHLFLGTQSDNVRDCHAKGRASNNLPEAQRGVHNALSKLTDDQVRAIRASNKTQMVLAAEYGVSQARISKIIRRESWTHV